MTRPIGTAQQSHAGQTVVDAMVSSVDVSLMTTEVQGRPISRDPMVTLEQSMSMWHFRSNTLGHRQRQLKKAPQMGRVLDRGTFATGGQCRYSKTVCHCGAHQEQARGHISETRSQRAMRGGSSTESGIWSRLGNG